MRIPAAPAQSHAAHKKIEEASDLPQETGEVPSGRAPNPLDRGKSQGRGNAYLYGPGIHQPRPKPHTTPRCRLPPGGESIGPAGQGEIAAFVMESSLNGFS